MTQTKADNFYNDSRVSQALSLLEESLKEHQSSINQVQGPVAELKTTYDEAFNQLGKDRGSPPFYKYLGSGIGNGPLVELADGSVKYDFIIGIGVHHFGHSHPEVMKAMVKGAISNTAMQGNLQQNVDQATYMNTLLSYANKYQAGFDHCFFTTTGAMAGENALKMIFQKLNPKSRVFAFEKCFMGRTLAISQITDKPVYRDGLPESLRVDYIPFYDENDHEGSIKRSVEALKEQIKRHPDQHAVFCMELIQGEAGSWVGNTDFFNALIDVCKEHHIAILVDEVQTFARTSELFAFQHFKLDKRVDFVNIGKNSQVCATFFRKEFKPRPGLVSQTFTAAGTAISAGQYIVDTLMKNNYFGEDGKNMQIHRYFTNHLKELNKKYPQAIKGPHGIGVMVAMTLFEGDAHKSKEFTKKLFDAGVLSFVAGSNPTRVRFLLPAGCIEEKHMDDVAQIIESVIKDMI